MTYRDESSPVYWRGRAYQLRQIADHVVGGSQRDELLEIAESLYRQGEDLAALNREARAERRRLVKLPASALTAYQRFRARKKMRLVRGILQ